MVLWLQLLPTLPTVTWTGPLSTNSLVNVSGNNKSQPTLDPHPTPPDPKLITPAMQKPPENKLSPLFGLCRHESVLLYLEKLRNLRKNVFHNTCLSKVMSREVYHQLAALRSLEIQTAALPLSSTL